MIPSAPPNPARPPGRRVALLACALALVASGCGSLTFPRHWGHFRPVQDASGMVGRWQGTWESEWNGHSGGLRCMTTRRAEGAYRAWFRASYAVLLVFEHETLFHVTGGGEGTLVFEGTSDLGELFGGVYRYEGRIEGDVFEARYQAENGDHGVFRMRRLADPPPE